MNLKEVIKILRKIKKNGKGQFLYNSTIDDYTINDLPYGFTRTHQRPLGPKKFYIEINVNSDSAYLITSKYIKYAVRDEVVFDSTTMNKEDYFNLLVSNPSLLTLDELKYIQKYGNTIKPKFYYICYELITSGILCSTIHKAY